MNYGSELVKAIVLSLSVLLLFVAAIAAHAVVSRVGDHASVGSISRIAPYAAYYWSLAIFLVMLCWLALRPRAGFALAVVPPGLGVLPEGILSLLPSFNLDPAAEVSIVRMVEAIEAPAFFLLWIIAEYKPDRFATGLSDPPTRMTLLGLSSIGCMNGLVWLAVALGLHSVLTRSRSRRTEG